MYKEVEESSKKRQISVNSVLKVLGVSSSGYYDYLKRQDSNQKIRKQQIKQEIIEIYNESKQIYGAPKITSILRSRGYVIAEKTVGNYMRELGIKAIWVSPYKRTTIDPDFDNKLKNILDRNFSPNAPNTVWVTDITYVWTVSGFVYLTTVMDLFSRRVIGWHLSDTLCVEGVLRAINKAKSSRKLDTPIIIHSDRGVQYVSKAYIDATPAGKFIRSYSKKGTPWDNAVIESFHALIKREWLNRFVIRHISHAHELIFEYVEAFYNTKRIHSYCEMSSPYDFEDKYVG
ncbi:MAG: IS3 family transposase [Tissierellia bacterium]|uniref:IS3 family transposase n=1 Tax=Proteiniborus sp. TaxID=2079015 RepID=UPI001695367A|nr:IS3 family transposase [Tissierellia bacterium]NLW42394.1 IS3 family transposase [Tissierellia bacterium]